MKKCDKIKSNIKNYFKLNCLKSKRIFFKLVKNLRFNISVALLIFSFVTSLFILFPRVFNQMPIFSYLVVEWELPYLHNISGEFQVINNSGEVITTEAEIYIGGYSVKTDKYGHFELNFSSPKSDTYYAVICYNVEDDVFNDTIKVSKIHESDFEFYKEISIIYE